MNIGYLKKAFDIIEKGKAINYDFYNPYPKQLLFNQLGLKAKQRLFLAANRIGKTLVCSCEVAFHLTGNYPQNWQGYRYNRPVKAWVGGLTHETIESTLKPLYFTGDDKFPRLIDESLIIKKKEQNNIYFIQHSSGGVSELQFKSYDQKGKKWQSKRLDICHLDEEPPMDIYVEAFMRLTETRENSYSMMLISATCLYFTEFVLSFTERIEKTSDGQIKQIQNESGEIYNNKVYVVAGFDDVTHITEEKKKEIIASLPPHEVKARTTGIPSVGSGMVYPVLEETITCNPIEIPPHFARVYGIDFGWEDPTAVIFAAIDRDKDIIYFVDEYSVNHATPSEHSVRLLKMGCDWMPGVYDPSGRRSNEQDGTKMINLYNQAGLRNLTKAKNSREEGVMEVLQLMRRGKIKIFNTLNNTLRELRMYARDKGIIKDGNDHLLDAMRYVVMSGRDIATTKTSQEAMNGYYRGNYGGSWMGT